MQYFMVFDGLIIFIICFWKALKITDNYSPGLVSSLLNDKDPNFQLPFS
jgi:hypothetical protein